MIKILSSFVVFAGAVFLGVCLSLPPLYAADINVIAGPAARSAMLEIAPAFERSTSHKLHLDYALIPSVRPRVAAGEVFDVMIMTPAFIDELIKQGKIASETRSNVGRTGLGVVIRKGAPKPNISSVEAFRQMLLNTSTVTYSASGTSGPAFLSVIDRLGIANEMKPKLKTFSAGIYDAIESGDANLGVTGIGAALANTKIEYVGALPAEIQVYIGLTAGISTSPKEPDGAKALIKYLTDPAIVSILRSKGLEPF